MNGGERKFVYSGPALHGRPKPQAQAPLSPSSALQTIRDCWTKGRIHITPHFKRRGVERRFDTLDAETVTKKGRLRGAPEFCVSFQNWKYSIAGFVEGRELEIIVALDPAEDYHDSPLLVLLTGFWR